MTGNGEIAYTTFQNVFLIIIIFHFQRTISNHLVGKNIFSSFSSDLEYYVKGGFDRHKD